MSEQAYQDTRAMPTAPARSQNGPMVDQALRLDRMIGEHQDLISTLMERLTPLRCERSEKMGGSAIGDDVPAASEHTRHLRDMGDRVEAQSVRLRLLLGELEV